MALQLNSAVTKALATNFGRLGTSCRIIFVKDTVAIPTSLSAAALSAYFDSFMLTANADNYLGSVTISGYQQFNNTITFSTAVGTTPLKTGTIGSAVITHSTSTGAPVALTTSSGYEIAKEWCFCITDSIGTADDPKMIVLGDKNLTAGGTTINFMSATISMVSSY